MKSWFHIWPLLAFPYVIFIAVGGIAFIREGFLNRVMIPFLPYDIASDLVNWYQSANFFQEFSLHILISINCGTLVYPLFFIIGSLYIKINNVIAVSKIKSFNNQ